MSDENQFAVPRSFWIIAGVALVWNLVGVANYLFQVTMTDEMLMQMPEEQRLLIESVPPWATAAFAVAVFGGTLGCVLLLLRKAIATPVFVVSMAGVIVQLYHTFAVANAMEVYGPAGLALPALVVAIGALLIWYSHSSAKNGWIS
jgi:hypothetical protein